jgi:hypothetical protein
MPTEELQGERLPERGGTAAQAGGMTRVGSSLHRLGASVIGLEAFNRGLADECLAVF